MADHDFECIVLGGGPGGYVAAIRAAQRGLKTALIEGHELGGTCLNRGCIPSKALIANTDVLRHVREANRFGITIGDISFNYSAMKERKDALVNRIRKNLEGLIASNQIRIFKGFGKFLSPCELKILGSDEIVLKGKSIILATGSEPRALPHIPYDYHQIHDSTSFLNLVTLPKKILIIGGGVIGCEFASLHNALGVDVTVVELLPTILSTEGRHISDFMTQSLKKQGIKIETNISIDCIEKDEQGIRALVKEGKNFEADCALVSVGRKFNTDEINLEKTGIIVTKNGSIPVNEYMQTNVPHIFAIGDITGKWMLAHVASHQGLIAAENASGNQKTMLYNAIPSVIFTHPEVGSVGYTLEKALEAGFDAQLGKFPFQALGKAQAALETEGFAQIVVDKATGQILGAQVIGYGAATLIAEMVVAIANELTVESISESIHAHPTTSEAWLEAALAAEEIPLHLPPLKKKNLTGV